MSLLQTLHVTGLQPGNAQKPSPLYSGHCQHRNATDPKTRTYFQGLIYCCPMSRRKKKPDDISRLGSDFSSIANIIKHLYC